MADALGLHQACHGAAAARQVGEVVGVHLPGQDAKAVLPEDGFKLPGVGAVVAGGAEDLPEVGPWSSPDAPKHEAGGRQAAVPGGPLPPVRQVDQSSASPKNMVPISSTVWVTDRRVRMFLK